MVKVNLTNFITIGLLAFSFVYLVSMGARYFLNKGE